MTLALLAITEDGVNGLLLENVRPLVDRVMWPREKGCAIQRVDVASEYYRVNVDRLNVYNFQR